MDLHGRTVIVTGGASGSGRAPALLLANEGARTLIGDIDKDGGRTAAAEGAAAGLAVEFLPVDLTSRSSIEDFVAAVHERVERVDGLVNAAGWDAIQPFLENPPEMCGRVIAVNLMGAIPFRRIAQPVEIAQAVLFFLSDRANYITGQVLSVTAG